MPLNLSLCLTVEKCLRGLTVGSSFVYICIMDQAVGEKKDTGTYFAASTSVEMLFSQLSQFMYHVPILYSLSALLCVSHNAPCCRLFNSPEHHNGCPLHYIWLAYSRVKFEYILALFTTTSFLRGGYLSNSLNINYHNLLKAL